MFRTDRISTKTAELLGKTVEVRHYHTYKVVEDQEYFQEGYWMWMLNGHCLGYTEEEARRTLLSMGVHKDA